MHLFIRDTPPVQPIETPSSHLTPPAVHSCHKSVSARSYHNPCVLCMPLKQVRGKNRHTKSCIGERCKMLADPHDEKGRSMSQFVLIIDDSVTVRKIFEVCLHRAGYSVKSFADGVEALRWLNTAEVQIPDLI